MEKVQCAIQAAVLLKRSNFPLEKIVDRQRDQQACTAGDDDDMGRRRCQCVVMDPTDPELQRQHPDLQISSALASEILWAAAEKVSGGEDWARYTKDPDKQRCEWQLAIVKRIWIWYDYCSLPQHDEDEQKDGRFRNPEDRRIMDATLDNLLIVQSHCHTLTLSYSENYFARAWCFTEYQHGSATRAGDRTEFGYAVQTERKHEDLLCCQAFALLINASVGFGDLLSRMDLQFTDSDHESRSPTICWVLWNSVLRRRKLTDDYYEYPYSANEIFVGRARQKNLKEWLRCIKEAFQNTWSDGNPTNRLFSKSQDCLPHCKDKWMKIRERAFPTPLTDGEAVDRVRVNFQHGGRFGKNYFIEAIDVVIKEVQYRENVG